MPLTESQLTQVFFALSDPTRRAIVSRLAQGSATVGALAQPFAISAPAITKHVKILERARLVTRRVSGREHRCVLRSAALRHAEDWLNFHREFWETRLDRLEAVLDAQGDSPATTGNRDHG